MAGSGAASAADLLRPARVVTVAGVHVVVPVDHDAPPRVRARVAANDRSKRPGPRHQQFHDDIAASVRVLRDRDGIALTDDQVRDWTAVLVGTITSRFTVQELQPCRTNAFEEGSR